MYTSFILEAPKSRESPFDRGHVPPKHCFVNRGRYTNIVQTHRKTPWNGINTTVITSYMPHSKYAPTIVHRSTSKVRETTTEPRQYPKV